jgi:hypothetical protein
MAVNIKKKNGDVKINPVEDANRSNILFIVGIPAGKRVIYPIWSG